MSPLYDGLELRILFSHRKNANMEKIYPDSRKFYLIHNTPEGHNKLWTISTTIGHQLKNNKCFENKGKFQKKRKKKKNKEVSSLD